jgi:SAM-dependent methyltransferase
MSEDNINPQKYVIGKIHPNEDMLSRPDGKLTRDSYIHYNSVGFSALSNIEEALEAANTKFENVRYCLDLPSGYGRVLRVLQTKINASEITACDIREEAVLFCSSEFGAEPLISNADFRRIDFRKKYDLIWVGSLCTHISERSFSALLEVLYNVLENCGVLVFTTHGEYSIERIIDKNKNVYRVPFPEKERLIRIFKNKGYYFTAYPHSKDYGISICSPEYVFDKISKLFRKRSRLLMYKYRGWDRHQDVYAYQRL